MQMDDYKQEWLCADFSQSRRYKKLNANENKASNNK